MPLLGIPSPQEMWAKHELLVLEVFTHALEMLREKTDLPIEELAISETLALKTRQANFALNQKGRGLPFPPDWEKPRQPAYETALGQSKKAKRPDFSCPFQNHSAQSYTNAYIDYHIECKRLGKTLSSGWNFNKNYMTEGVHRFVSPIHRYGEGAFSGAMIGYVQNTSLRSILDEVNHLIPNSPVKVPLLGFLEDEFGREGIIKTSQQLIRTQVLPSPFELRHIWVDLRQQLNEL